MTMIKAFWINLPVKDLEKSRKFFTKIGFVLNPRFAGSSDTASLLIGDKSAVVMLFTEPAFKGFAANDIADARQATEVLLSIDAESRDEVDAMAKKVEEAGGTIYGKPGEKDGWMYGCGFIDPDGHRWSILHMDMSRMPK
jgi:uncharacterized protein